MGKAKGRDTRPQKEPSCTAWHSKGGKGIFNNNSVLRCVLRSWVRFFFIFLVKREEVSGDLQYTDAAFEHLDLRCSLAHSEAMILTHPRGLVCPAHSWHLRLELMKSSSLL